MRIYGVYRSVPSLSVQPLPVLLTPHIRTAFTTTVPSIERFLWWKKQCYYLLT